MNHTRMLFVLLLSIFIGRQDLYAQVKIEITNSNSLVRWIPQDQLITDINDTDQVIATTFYNALLNKDMDSVRYVEKYYFEKGKKEMRHNNEFWVLYWSLYWISKCIEINKQDLEKEINDPLSKDMYYFFTENDFERLKEFLKFRYGLFNYKFKDKDKITFKSYFNFLALNAPIREEWEKTSEIMSWLPLKKGDKIIDLGCGWGYNTFQLSKIVGEEGKVYATDILREPIDHLKQITEKSGIKNIFPVVTTETEIGISDSVDAVLMSLIYQGLYLKVSENERVKLLRSMKQVVKTDGYFIMSVFLYKGKELGFRYIDKRLLIAQMAYWGFSIVKYKEFAEHRFVLVFKNTNEKVKEQTLFADERPSDTSFLINVYSEKSIINTNRSESFIITEKGKQAATFAYDFFKTGSTESAKKAISAYKEIIPIENFGGDYSAILWLCEVQSSPEDERNLIFEMNPLSKSFYNTMTNNDNSLIKDFLLIRYKLFKEGPQNHKGDRTFLENYVLDMNPKREEWEKSNLIVQNMKLQKGQIVADLGSGLGYFTYRFSQMVGNEGKVYAIEFNDEPLNTLNNFIKEQEIKNIETIKEETESYSIHLKEKADIIFMCSFYNIIYSEFAEYDRQKFIKSIIENLDVDGKLIIVENGLVAGDKLPGLEPYMIKELIEYQLAFYGFELINDAQIIPQRYMLTFKLKGN